MHRLLALLLAVPLIAPQDPKKFPDALDRESLARIKDATVLIMATGPGLQASGSGFVVSPKGHIVTNRHVVEPRGLAAATEIFVYLKSGTAEQKKVKGEKVFVDPDCDLALIKVEGEGLTALTIGDPKELSETVTLWAFGYPFGNLFRDGDKGPEVTVNRGNVTSLRKNKEGALEAIQIDTQVNPGNSGGPLVSGDGRVFGVITAALADSSLRFAIPSDLVKKLLAPRISRAAMVPSTLTVAGGQVTFETEVTETLAPAERVTAVIEGAGFQKEVELQRKDKDKAKVWTGTWDCPELAADDRRRIEVSVTMRDKSVKSAVFKAPSVSVKTEFGNLSIPVADLEEIRFGEPGKPDRILTARGMFEGRLEPRVLEAGEKLEADRIQSARFETRTGRMFQIRMRVRAGTEEILGAPSPFAVGAPPPAIAAPAAAFESRIAGDLMEKRLPGAVANVKLAGGGRYLAIHFKSLGTLGFFDLERLEFVKHIQLQSDDVLFAPGRTKLLLCYPDKGRIERWSLETFERETTIETPFQGIVTNLEMGWNSEGPAVARVAGAGDRNSTGTIALLDPGKLKIIEIDLESSRSSQISGSAIQIRPSSSGSHFGWWRTQTSPSGVGLSRIGDRKIEYKYAHDGNGYVLPGDDGNLVFTRSGIYAGDDVTMTGGSRRRSEDQIAVLPAVEGPFYLTIQGGMPSGAGQESEARGALCLLSNRQKVVTLDFPLLDRWSQWPGQDGEMTLDRRIWLFPRAKVLISIPTTNDRVICRRLDVDALLDRAGVDFLFVASLPPVGARPRTEWTYPVAVKSKKGGVKLKLESAPDGMKADKDGTLRWTPKEEGIFTVILLVSDDSGQEIYHTFKVKVQ
ncbi:MAG TPA: trypsin-like peptidase domain-containing protein [Planctomycetota bacterium]|nr:trypsin-like peptidase domain-containing protein [Planctomycetota bacterium]